MIMHLHLQGDLPLGPCKGVYKGNHVIPLVPDDLQGDLQGDLPLGPL